MTELIQTEIDKKQINFFKKENQDIPVVYANMYTEVGQAVLKECEKLRCKPFHLVSITNLRWDEELSPWVHEPVVTKEDHFTGEAEQYVCCMTEKIVPFIENTIKPSYRIIAGYSMGGLFALYAPYVTDRFSAVVSASGSVWYPEFVSYVKTHDFLKNPSAIYLSLGDLESNTKNPFLRKTQDCMKELYTIFQGKSIDSIFELNQGNHYKDTTYRLAKGITWILESLNIDKI